MACLLMLALLLIPFVSLSPYKTLIQESFSSKYEGTLDFADAHLSILNGFAVQFKNINILYSKPPFESMPMLQADEAALHIDLGKVLDKNIHARFVVNQPKLIIWKDSQKSSLNGFFKTKTTKENSVSPKKLEGNAGSQDLPKTKKQNWYTDIIFDELQIKNGAFEYKDLKNRNQIFLAEDLFLHIDRKNQEEVDIVLKALLKNKYIDGIVELSAKFMTKNRNLEEFLIKNGKVDFAKSRIEVGNIFKKDNGKVFNILFDGSVQNDYLSFDNITANGQNSEWTASAKIAFDKTQQSKIDLNVFDGTVSVLYAFKKDDPSLLTTQFGAKNVSLTKVLDFLNRKDMQLSGKIELDSSFDVFLAGQHISEGNGSFKVISPNVSEHGLTKIFQKNLDKKLASLPFVDANSLAALLKGGEGHYSDILGKFKILDDKIYLESRQTQPMGVIWVSAVVDKSENLSGQGKYVFSKKVKQKVVDTIKKSKWILDDKGDLDIQFALAGSLKNPEIDINFDAIKKRFEKNAGKKIEDEIKDSIKNLSGDDGKNNFEQLRKKLKDKLEKNNIRIPGL